MRQLHQYFSARKALTLTMVWVFFAVTLGYMLLCLTLCPQWPYWLCLIPGLLCLYFRLTYSSIVGRSPLQGTK